MAKGETPEGVNALPWPPSGWKLDYTTFIGDTRTDMSKPVDYGMADKTTVILSERQTTHGHIEDNAYYTAKLTEAMMLVAPKLGKLIWLQMGDTPRLCLWMIAHKIGRILSGNWREPDHWRDIAGYATLIADRLERGELQ